MVAGDVYKILVNECCRSLSFNDEERQFSFPLLPSQRGIWRKIRDKVHRIDPNFNLEDYNRALLRFEDAIHQYETIPIGDISDSELLCGEILDVTPNESNGTLLLVKMGCGQYLDVLKGKGLTLGSEFVFKRGCQIKTSEGFILGSCKNVKLRIPMLEHIALGRHFLGTYYNHPVSSSLWQLYYGTVDMLERGGRVNCKKVLSLSSSLGISAFTMLYILQGVVETWSRHQNMTGR